MLNSKTKTLKIPFEFKINKIYVYIITITYQNAFFQIIKIKPVFNLVYKY